MRTLFHAMLVHIVLLVKIFAQLVQLATIVSLVQLLRQNALEAFIVLKDQVHALLVPRVLFALKDQLLLHIVHLEVIVPHNKYLVKAVLLVSFAFRAHRRQLFVQLDLTVHLQQAPVLLV